MKKALYLILAGVAIGILVAPRKGSETWEKLVDEINDWKNEAMDKVDDLKSKGDELFKKGKSAAGDLNRDVYES